MKKLTHPVRQLLNQAQRRFVRSRPGSVLILVVALLVLMALIGTAYMTMAQFDRFSAAQHAFNTEVDLLLDGVIGLTKGTVTSDVFVQGQFRPGNPTYNNNPQPAAGQSNYNYWNGVGLDSAAATVAGSTNPGDWWIGSRVPEAIGPNAGWPFISGALNGGGTFDTPYWPAGTAIRYSLRNGIVPGATTATVDGQFQPAFLNIPDPSSPGAFLTVMAADTDADGIADAGLFKLPVGTLDGITYYAAVRIIDNCAAINASIATRPNPTGAFTAGSGLPGDFSPANLDMEGMLVPNMPGTPPFDLYAPVATVTAANPQGLLNYRFNATPSFPITPSATAIDEMGIVRGDFMYMLYNFNGFNLAFDQQWMQLGRRLENPGNIVPGPTSGSKYQALPISESMTMARGFVLRDPSVATWPTSPSVLEQKMPYSTFVNAPTAPYPPGNTVAWFNANFNYTPGANTNSMLMRSLLVARNPVSNFAPGKFTERGVSATGTGAYNFGDMITYGSHRFVCINPNPTAAPLLASSGDPYFHDPNWAFEPWTTAPTKTNVNTASFQQLYAAYWAVMADHLTAGIWQPPFPSNASATPHMFRNPIRKTGTVLTAPQVMYLRAAIAAVNTLDLRDSDDDVTSRTITIPGTPYQATIYGAEKQPYITQVYARNDPTPANSWVGIEIYNPYPTPMTLTNYQFVAMIRTVTPMTLTLINAIPTTTIPGRGRLVFVSSTTNAAATMPTPMPPATVTIVALANLATLGLGNEVLLMRPRRADGTLTVPNPQPANNTFTEDVTTNFTDLVPVDSYDFTNLPATAITAQEWDYIRPSASAVKNWHFVYPGPWNDAATGTIPTLGGTTYMAAPATTTNSSALGTAQGAVASGGTPSLAPYQDVPLQINNVDFGGPLKVSQTTPTGNYFPFGGFARNADMLEVTYIGAYKIWQWPAAAGGVPIILEINTLPMDSAMATANDVSPYTPIGTSVLAAENIGRFCPIDKADTAGTYDDFGVDPAKWRYHWATRLFDFLTVMSPQDDYLPEVDPWHVEPTSAAPPPPGYPTAFKYYPGAAGGALLPQAVSNVSTGIANALYSNAAGTPTFNANNVTEETAPINGLVNINTAPWRVLAAVPWAPASVAGYQGLNAQVAQAITFYRDVNDGSGMHGHGPFKSIFELNDVPYPQGSLTLLRDYLGNAATFQTPQYGYLAPITPVATDLVTGDFEMQFQTLARVSNLITTRSDSYTAYILVQGWRNAETSTPSLVVQRRAAIIIDRSAVTSTNATPNVINVPLN
jgi:hypothetical protein